MSRQAVLDYVRELSWGWTSDTPPGLADLTAVSGFYDEVITTLAADPRLWFAHWVVGTSSLDQELHQVPDDLVRLLGVFYDQTMLSWETQQAMEALDPRWRERRHTPVAYITDNVEDRYIRLWPPGDHDCEELGWLYTRTLTDAPSFMDLPIAFLVLAREFSKESAHRDLDFAKLAHELGTRMLEMVAPD